jgi:aspartate/methionine/tyrosine aminotransferase
VPQPSYPLLEFLATLDSVEAIPYRLSYAHPNEWRIDFDSLEAAISPRTRGVIVVNPNNPTGSFVNAQDRERLMAICTGNDMAVIADEVFGDYSWQVGTSTSRSFASQTSTLTFVVNGLSKIAGLPQMKLGWILANGPSASLRAARERLEVIADTYLSAGTPVQLATPRLLSLRATIRDQILERVLLNRGYVEDLVRGTSSRLLTGEGGWYAVLEVPRILSEEELVLKFLAEDDVLIHPGYFFNFEREAFLVLSLIPEIETFREGCRRAIARIEGLV